MKTILVPAAALLLFIAAPASARDFVSDPDAAMNQLQKLGPNANAVRVANNRIVITSRPEYHGYPRWRYRYAYRPLFPLFPRWW